VASAGLVANVVSAGTPAARQRAGSSTQQRGRYRAAVDERVAAASGVGQVHRDLGVLDPPGGAGVLPLHPDRVHALFQVAGLVDHQHGVVLGEGVDDVAAQVISHSVGIPPRPRQQMLQLVRRRVAAVLRDRPAVLAFQRGEHAEHQPARATQRLVPAKPRRDPIEHRTVRRPPPISIYAMSRGHRGEFVVRHKHRMLARWPHPSEAPRRTPRAPSTTKVTIYGCSTSRWVVNRENQLQRKKRLVPQEQLV
jgi:hypothetical protein